MVEMVEVRRLFARLWKSPEIAEIEKRKEQGMGPLVGKQDWHIRLPKRAVQAAVIATTLATPPYLMQRHQAQIARQQTVAAAVEHGEQGKLLRMLKAAGVQDPDYWARATRSNLRSVEPLSHMVKPLEPGELRELEKWLSHTYRTGGMPLGSAGSIHPFMPVLKAMNPYAKTEEDFAGERDRLAHATDLVSAGKDNWYREPLSSLLFYAAEHHREPGFRRLLLKLREYALLDLLPFGNSADELP